MAMPPDEWAVISESVRGAAHVRSDLPNQDAVFFKPDSNGPFSFVVAVSDGHGSPKSFRSAQGSRMATRVAVDVTHKFLEGMKDAAPSVIKDAAERQLPTEILRHWTEAVTDDHVRHPFSEEELDQLERQVGVVARQAISNDPQPLLAYGATLLAVAITKSFLLYLQLGDGDILTVADNTRAAERPLPQDPSLIANETTSLCMRGARNLFRIRFQHLQGSPPSLILVSTDGYANAFASDIDFLKVGADLLELLQTKGPDYVKQNINLWLNDASQQGSGDDVTLAIIYRRDLLSNSGISERLLPEAGRENSEEKAKTVMPGPDDAKGVTS